MKKTIIQLAATLAFSLKLSTVAAQTYAADFESFTLTPSSYYKDTTSAPFQTTNALFRYSWDTGFDYWSGGSSYTNIHDSTSGGFTNLYNCRPKFGYLSSNNYVTAQDRAVIVVKAPYDQVDGFYITNTTYAFKSMKNGDSFAKKFGGTSGNDPDWFKITAKGYLNGTMKTDSSVFYLADFRFANNALDYIVGDWQWFNTINLGQVDSIKFFMYSSDVGSFGINTPLYFSLDNFTTTDNVVGLTEYSSDANVNIYPNPFHDRIALQLSTEEDYSLEITDIAGKKVYSETNTNNQTADLSFMQAGIYFAEIRIKDQKTIKKIIKN
jgi:hypothetical protein